MKAKLLLCALLLLIVEGVMAQSNPPATNSQNAAAIANGSGEYVAEYHLSSRHEAGAGWSFIDEESVDLADGAGGWALSEFWVDFGSPTHDWLIKTWPTNAWPQDPPSGTMVEILDGVTNLVAVAPPFAPSVYEHSDAYYAMAYPQDYNALETFHKHVETKLTLATGGLPGSTNVNLWAVSATATAQTIVPGGGMFPDDPPVNSAIGAIPYTSISAGVFGKLDERGFAFKLLPDNTNVDVTPYVAGNDHYTFNDPPGPVTLLSLDVVSNSAVQVGGTNNWAAVKTATNDWVYIQATLSTGDTNAANQISWSAGEKVPGNPWQRRVTKTNSAETIVTATLGSTNKTVNVWIIWSDLTIKTSGTLDPDDKAAVLNNGNFPTQNTTYGSYDLGGGNSLGAIDCLNNTNLNYAYTIGKMEAKAILQPSGIGNILTNGWDMRRSRIVIAWDNGGTPALSNPPPGVDDTGGNIFKYLNPVNGDIFDLDWPGCSIDLAGIAIIHTAECYDNFSEYVTVMLGGNQQICSDLAVWSYSAQVDIDAANQVQLNSLSASLITLPTTSHYTQR